MLLSVMMIAEAGCLFAPREVATACQDIFKMALSQFVVLFGKAVCILITALFNKVSQAPLNVECREWDAKRYGSATRALVGLFS